MSDWEWITVQGPPWRTLLGPRPPRRRSGLGEMFAAVLVVLVGTVAATVAIGALVFAATFQSVARWVRLR